MKGAAAARSNPIGTGKRNEPAMGTSSHKVSTQRTGLEAQMAGATQGIARVMKMNRPRNSDQDANITLEQI
eukprot:4988660-Pleurochrysis_carterae.AAC.2